MAAMSAMPAAGATVGGVMAFRAALFGGAGLVIGSFLTVVVYRLPRGLSVVAPRSACPGCGSPVRPRDNVPVVSYLLLRGRCRGCDVHIAAEYPAVEALTGALFVAAALRFPGTWQAVLSALLFAVLLAAALIDARHRIIPNRLTYPALAGGGLLIMIAWAADSAVSPLGALAGSALLAGGFLLVALVSPAGMGLGDVKLAAVIGLVLGSFGLRYVAVAAAIAVLAGGIGGIVALLLGRKRTETIPFGPYLATGAVAATFLGPQVAAWYGGLIR
jgi:leader peptidase (prepilin peptidase)/N-methyltransferase